MVNIRNTTMLTGSLGQPLSKEEQRSLLKCLDSARLGVDSCLVDGLTGLYDHLMAYIEEVSATQEDDLELVRAMTWGIVSGARVVWSARGLQRKPTKHVNPVWHCMPCGTTQWREGCTVLVHPQARFHLEYPSNLLPTFLTPVLQFSELIATSHSPCSCLPSMPQVEGAMLLLEQLSIELGIMDDKGEGRGLGCRTTDEACRSPRSMRVGGKVTYEGG